MQAVGVADCAAEKCLHASLMCPPVRPRMLPYLPVQRGCVAPRQGPALPRWLGAVAPLGWPLGELGWPLCWGAWGPHSYVHVHARLWEKQPLHTYGRGHQGRLHSQPPCTPHRPTFAHHLCRPRWLPSPTSTTAASTWWTWAPGPGPATPPCWLSLWAFRWPRMPATGCGAYVACERLPSVHLPVLVPCARPRCAARKPANWWQCSVSDRQR